jgi:hypothetical protein
MADPRELSAAERHDLLLYAKAIQALHECAHKLRALPWLACSLAGELNDEGETPWAAGSVVRALIGSMRDAAKRIEALPREEAEGAAEAADLQIIWPQRLAAMSAQVASIEP